MLHVALQSASHAVGLLPSLLVPGVVSLGGEFLLCWPGVTCPLGVSLKLVSFHGGAFFVGPFFEMESQHQVSPPDPVLEAADPSGSSVSIDMHDGVP